MSVYKTGTVYATGSLYGGGTKYWVLDKMTVHFLTFRKLRWSEDFVNEKGVMYKTDEALRVKVGKIPYKNGVGAFREYDQPVTVKEAE